MIKRLFAAVLCAVLCAAALAGCGSSGADQTLKVNWQQEPPDLDPQTSQDQISFWILNATLEGLFRYQPDGTLGDGLAESYEVSDDKLTYTFHLRDAKWSDGTPITSEDFAYAWLRALDPATASEYSYMLYYIKNGEAYFNGEITDQSEVGIEVVDDKTFTVTLERPTPYFLGLTSFPTYMPAQKAAVEQWGDDYGLEANQMVYSGPFIIGDWVHEQSLTLEKNPEYWDKKAVKLQSIYGVVITENNTIVQMYESGDLDMTDVPDDFYDTYKDSPDYGKLAQAGSWFLMYNCEGKYLSNQKIRQAFSMAVDKQTFVDTVMNGMGIVADGLVSSSLSGKGGKTFGENRAEAGITLPPFDPEQAKTLLAEGLAELGYTKEEMEAETTIIGSDSDTWSKYLQYLQAQFNQNLGLEIGLEQMTFAERLDRYDAKTYELALAGWGADYNDPMSFLDMWVTGNGNNEAYWSNAAYDAAIDQAIVGTGDERIDAYLEAERQLSIDLPICPIYYPIWDFVTKPYVKGVALYVTGSDYDFKWTSIEK